MGGANLKLILPATRYSAVPLQPALGAPNITPNAQIAAIPPSLTTNPSGALGGLQFGYNYRVGRYVAGWETDFPLSDLNGSNTQSGIGNIFGTVANFLSSTTVSQRLEDFGTVRGRLGFLPTDQVLLYTTGGLAYGKVATSVGIGETLTNCGIFAPCPVTPAAGSKSSYQIGWTIGAGLESVLAGGPWSVKAEYLYVNLTGTTFASSPLILSTGLVAPQDIVGVTAATSHLQANIVRVGLNYNFK